RGTDGGNLQTDFPQSYVHYAMAGRFVCGSCRKITLQTLQQVAERTRAVSLIHYLITAGQQRSEPVLIAIVGKHPGLSPEFPLKRVAVAQADITEGCLADMGQDRT